MRARDVALDRLAYGAEPSVRAVNRYGPTSFIPLTLRTPMLGGAPGPRNNRPFSTCAGWQPATSCERGLTGHGAETISTQSARMPSPVKSKPPVRVIQRNGQRAWCRYLSTNRTAGPSSRDKQSPCPDAPEESGGCPRCRWEQPSWPKVFLTIVISRSWPRRTKDGSVRFPDGMGAKRARTARSGCSKRSCGGINSPTSAYGFFSAGTHSSEGFFTSSVSGPNWLFTKTPTFFTNFARSACFTW